MSNVLLIHGNGTNGTTYVPDYSPSAHPMECIRSAAVSTTQKKFGTGSLSFTTAQDVVSSADSADWAFGAGSFTIECWAYWTSDPSADHSLIGQWTVLGNLSWLLNYHSQTNKMEFYTSVDGSAVQVKLSGTFTPTLNQWYNIAVDYNGTTYRLYIDGVMNTSGAAGVTLFNSAAPLQIGNSGLYPALGAQFPGFIDEIAIDKGTAKYNSNGGYTPQTVEFTPTTLTPSPLRVSQGAIIYLAGVTAPVQVSQAATLVLVREIKKRVITEADTRN